MAFPRHNPLKMNSIRFAFLAVGPRVAAGGIFPPPDAALELLANLPPPKSFQVRRSRILPLCFILLLSYC